LAAPVCSVKAGQCGGRRSVLEQTEIARVISGEEIEIPVSVDVAP
jgi:hypothetical protein